MTNSAPRNHWRKITIATCVGVCAIAAACYWYTQMREEKELPNSSSSMKAKNVKDEDKPPTEVKDVQRSKADVLAIMDRVIETQVKLRRLIRDAIKHIIDGKLTGVKQIYEFVDREKPDDPLQAHGLTMAEFDLLMNKWQDDPDVTLRTFTIVNGPAGESDDAEMYSKAGSLVVDQIVEIHQGVLKRLEEGHAEMLSLQKTIEAAAHDDISPKFDQRTAHLVLQVLVGEFTERIYGVCAEAIEYAAVAHHNILMGKPDYIAVHASIQELLDQFNS